MRPVYCDESIWIPVADGLQRRGWDIRTAREEGTLGDPDRDQLAYARGNDWVLLTFDDDFLSLVEGEGVDHAGLIYVQQAGKQIGDVWSGQLMNTWRTVARTTGASTISDPGTAVTDSST